MNNFLLTTEIKDEEELKKYIKNNNIKLPDYKCAVIALITNKKGDVLLQRRGLKSRDDNNLLSDIGGACEAKDKNFKAALLREISEELGQDAQITIDFFVGAYLIKKFDHRIKQYINWLFLIYKCTYIKGTILIPEPDKCLGYEFYPLNKLPLQQMPQTSRDFWQFYKINYLNK